MRTYRHHSRRGSVLVLGVILMMAAMAVVALSVDIGYVQSVRTQMQRSADAAALAGANVLLDDLVMEAEQQSRAAVVNESATFSYANEVGSMHPQLAEDDVIVGRLQNLANPNEAISTAPGQTWNAARVAVRRTDDLNGEIPLFFAKVLTRTSLPESVEATGAFWTSVGGFTTPPNGGNLGILPFALDQTTWDGLLAGSGTDNWRYDPETGVVSAGQDGKLEVNLFPQGTGSPGNRGTVDIGSPGNSTNDIKRQILDGINASDLAFHNGKLEFDDSGILTLNGDTGISAAVKAELTEIKGQPRAIPIFQSVAGNGNNAMYSIVEFVGVRVMEVNLTGKMTSKRVMVQMAPMIIPGAIPSTNSGTSHFIYTPVSLIR
ncbi:MAG: pilus assembly protein TadG-related protein [Planctomycetota bacterium]|nr:pilus assembly protein TadG-related protein [Planctomycetota bacterium]MDA1180521.1 pilus assembly protein TadG-related protein [Planctomycetota bacterium]